MKEKNKSFLAYDKDRSRMPYVKPQFEIIQMNIEGFLAASPSGGVSDMPGEDLTRADGYRDNRMLNA